MNRERRPAGRPDTARLVIADDHELVRAGLRSLLAGERGLEVVGEAADGRQALALCRELRPDLVLIDVRMPGLDGLAATTAIKQEHPEISVIIVTMHENADYLIEAIRAGAAGYVLKGASKRELLTTIRQVLGGESALPPELATQLFQRLAADAAHAAAPAPTVLPTPPPSTPSRSSPSGPSPLDQLTPREREVLQLVARGQTNQEIGRELTVSVSTVKTHLEHIIAKLGVSDRTQAAVRAAELGLLTSSQSS
ncbi:MAG: response regulator transcription factor [Chloroflexota bacterium]|nr:response regulator transcription factor [Chloroflexota bacterium]